MRAKIVFAAIAMFLSIQMYGQVNNFSIVDGKVIWQLVYESPLSLDEIEKKIIDSGGFVDIINTGDKLTFRAYRAKVDYERYGYKFGNTVVFVIWHDLSFFCTIQTKDGKYRATVDNLVLVENTTNGFYTDGKERDFSSLVIKNGKFRSQFEGMPSDVYNKLLTELLDVKDKSYLNNDW